MAHSELAPALWRGPVVDTRACVAIRTETGMVRNEFAEPFSGEREREPLAGGRVLCCEVGEESDQT